MTFWGEFDILIYSSKGFYGEAPNEPVEKAKIGRQARS
jgi:hypothetical protein